MHETELIQDKNAVVVKPFKEVIKIEVAKEEEKPKKTNT